MATGWARTPTLGHWVVRLNGSRLCESPSVGSSASCHGAGYLAALCAVASLLHHLDFYLPEIVEH